MTPFFVIPEIFNRESKFLLFLLILNAFGPRLKNCRGDEKGAIEPFRGGDLPFLSFPKSFIGNPNILVFK